MNRFHGKVALVTGSSRGIGRACAVELARQGANVAVNYRADQHQAEKTVKEIESLDRVYGPIQADTSSSSQVALMVEAVERDFGGIDILVNNAGMLKRTPFLEISESKDRTRS